MGVIRADVILLRGGNSETRARLEEEFVDGDVRRQRARVQRERIGELRIAGEQALRDRREEAPFEIALAARRLERECGEDAQPDRWIGDRAGEQRIGDVIGFAQPERQSERDRLADAGDDFVGHALRICECDRSARAARHTDPFTPRTRCIPSPACGGGLGRGHATRFVRACPLPTPPPFTGEGADRVRRSR
jgi:hypothetical protein